MLYDLILQYPSISYCVGAALTVAMGSWLLSRGERYFECPRIDAMDDDIQRYQAMGGRPKEWPEPDADTLPGLTLSGATRAHGKRGVAA